MRCFLVSSLLIAGLLSTARAERPISPAALVELERGEQLYRDKDYAAAIAAFDAGYQLDPQPIFLYDKAQALRMAGDCASAIEAYEAFLATEPPEHEAIRARKNIENCAAKLSRSPAPPVEETAPAARVPRPVLPPRPRVRKESLPAGEERAWWHDRVGVTLATSGVIALGLGAGFAVAARKAADDTALVTHLDEWNERRAAWQRDRLVAGVAAGTGIALVALAVVRFSTHDRTVRVTSTAHGGAVVAIGGAW